MWPAVLLLVTAQFADGGSDYAIERSDTGTTVIIPMPGPPPQPQPQPQPVQPAPQPSPVQPAPQPQVVPEPQPPQPVPQPVQPLPVEKQQQPYQPQPQPQPYQPQGYAPPPAGWTPDAGSTKISLRGAFETDLGVFPSGYQDSSVDLMAGAHPVIGLSIGEDFNLELGPTFRFRLADFPPENRTSDVGNVLRGADWDEVSDYGQILQELRIGRETGPFHIRLGTVRKKTMGLGHLMWRYNAQLNPNYHPASGQLDVRIGPVRGEFFASDILGARMFGGEIGWDIGRTFSPDPALKDRYGLSLSLIHDANLAGKPFRPTPDLTPFTPAFATLLHLDLNAVLVRDGSLRWMLLGGIGTRANQRGDLGLVFGTTLDATLQEIGFSTRIEFRKQNGGFRHGFFGPMYELQRFVDIGFNGASIQDAQLPDSASVFGELRVGIGTRVTADAAAEYFFFNRVDLDGGLSLAIFDDWFYTTARMTVLGLLQAPRWSVTCGLRWRLFKSFYVTAEGGTLFFPQPDGSLLRGVLANAGIGLDFER
ncbi:MAG: hypothetical protein QM817_29715 [Archangium sp.]